MTTMYNDDLFTIDHAPVNDKHEEVQRLATNYNERLNALNKRISDLEFQLELAKNERKALLETAIPIKRPMAPFLRLPDDIVREIFAACLDLEMYPTMSRKEAPTLLTQISSSLRWIALAAPELWTTIHIPIIGSVSPNISGLAQFVMDKRAEGVKEWLLRRSGNLPLRISVRRASQEELDLDPPHVHLNSDIIDIVLSCCSRWRDIFFAISYTALLPRLAELSSKDVPLLQSFQHTPETGDRGLITEYVEFWPHCRFLASSNLRKFCAYTITDGLSELLLSFPIRWQYLTHLGLLGTAPVDNECITLCDTLRECHRLVSLKIVIGSRGSPSMGKVTFPTLKSLTVEEYRSEPEHIPGILAVIIAPALTTLVYNRDMDFIIGPPPISDNLLKLTELTPNLTRLTLGNCHSHEVLIKCVQHCPLLSYLHLDNFEPESGVSASTVSDDHLLTRIFLNDDCLCPRLDYFWCSKTLTTSLETSRNIIRRKNGSVPYLARWRTLKLDIFYEPRDEEEIEELCNAVIADDWKLIDISFCQVSRISRDLLDDIAHHVQPHRRIDTMWKDEDM